MPGIKKTKPRGRSGGRKLKYGEPTETKSIRFPISVLKNAIKFSDGKLNMYVVNAVVNKNEKHE